MAKSRLAVWDRPDFDQYLEDRTPPPFEPEFQSPVTPPPKQPYTWPDVGDWIVIVALSMTIVALTIAIIKLW